MFWNKIFTPFFCYAVYTNAEESSHCIYTSEYKFVIVVIKIFSQWSDTNKFIIIVNI